MKYNLPATALSLLLLTGFIYVIMGESFPSTSTTISESTIKNMNLGLFISQFRVLEVLSIAFVVLATVTCCIAMLREEE